MSRIMVQPTLDGEDDLPDGQVAVLVALAEASGHGGHGGLVHDRVTGEVSCACRARFGTPAEAP
jgi:hypothetical protein